MEVGRTCMKCGMRNIEQLQPNQIACKSCRTLFVLSDITDEEMIEWFAWTEQIIKRVN